MVGDGVTAVNIIATANVSSSAINGDISMYLYPNTSNFPLSIANTSQNVGNMGGVYAFFNPVTANEGNQITISGSFIPKVGENSYGIGFVTGGTAANRSVLNIHVTISYEPVQFN